MITDEILTAISTEVGKEVKPADEFSELNVDSLEFIDLCLQLERQFSTKISDADMAKISTVGDLINAVSRP